LNTVTTAISRIAARPVYRWLALLGVPLLLYAGSLRFPFTPLDEQWLIVHDAHRLADAKFLKEAFTSSIQNVYYRPLFLWTLFIDFRVSGLEPLWYHVTNVILHLASVVLLYHCLMIFRTSQNRAFLISLVFAAWPLHLHAVAWVPGRNDSMLCAFVLGSLLTLVRYLNGDGKKLLALHLILFSLALLTKETAVVLPAVFAAVALAVRPARNRIFMAAAAWVILVAGWTWVVKAVLPPLSWTPDFSLHGWQKFLIAMLEVAGKSLFPVRQSVMPVTGTFPLAVAIPVIALVSWLLARSWPEKRAASLPGLVLFLTMLMLPVWYGSQSALGEQYEHRLYTPLAGLALLLGTLRPPKKPATEILLLVVLLAAGMILTFQRMRVYANPSTFMTQAMNDSPRNYFLAMQQGNLNAETQHWSQAIECYGKAIGIQPGKAHLYLCRAVAYAASGKTTEASQDFTRTFELYRDEDLPGGMAYVDRIGGYYKPAASLGIMNRKIKNNPGDAKLYLHRASVYLNMKDSVMALRDLKQACRLDPSNTALASYYNSLYVSLRRRSQ
jgi:protein O-mannosyl-transferase